MLFFMPEFPNFYRCTHTPMIKKGRFIFGAAKLDKRKKAKANLWQCFSSFRFETRKFWDAHENQCWKERKKETKKNSLMENYFRRRRKKINSVYSTVLSWNRNVTVIIESVCVCVALTTISICCFLCFSSLSFGRTKVFVIIA